ncbi:metallophosphatase domain-containing protein [Runella limosa]|uniref:metallophosphatase domain-containing protein n=1 Tax=Runella limosa TaxID=370978 RepID=UPI00048D4746|nr:metallophosphatase domain-containing protein [Runella limosa]
MKIVCISDTHNLHRATAVPDGDILIHAGDITVAGDAREVADFNTWLGTLPHKHKVVVAGNHDFCFENSPQKTKALLTNAHYLQDSGVEIEGLFIWGSPVSPHYHDWAFNRKRGSEIRRHWKLIPPHTDLLITHCPPFGILDTSDRGSHEGCRDLLDVLQQRVRPRLHVFGHIHEAHGYTTIGTTQYVNASIVGPKGWTRRFWLLNQLTQLGIRIFRLFQWLKNLFWKTTPAQRHSSTLSQFQWEVAHAAIVIETASLSTDPNFRAPSKSLL